MMISESFEDFEKYVQEKYKIKTISSEFSQINCFNELPMYQLIMVYYMLIKLFSFFTLAYNVKYILILARIHYVYIIIRIPLLCVFMIVL